MTELLYIVAVDGSEWSKRAANEAITLASKTDAKVKLLTVLYRPTITPIAMEGIAPPVLDKAAEEKYAKANILQPIAESHSSTNVNISFELIWGDPVVEIKSQIEELKANMLFVGRKGRSSIIDILLGSVANKLAHCVSVPIVLVP